MNFDKAGYPYIAEDNIYHRLSQQTGGATVAEIDASFADDELVNPLEWKTNKVQIDGEEITDADPRWESKFNNWYHQLDINPEYLLQKCADKGVDLELQQDEAINSPFANSFYNTQVRKPEGDEVITGEEKFNIDLEEERKTAVQNYSKVQKEKEKDVYQNCHIAVPARNIEKKKDMICGLHMCNNIPFKGENDAVVENPRVSNRDDLDRLIATGALSPMEEAKYRYCADQNKFCNFIDENVNVSSEPPGKPFLHFGNAGGGACLFIAVAQYLKFAVGLGEFPDYGNNTVDEAKYKNIFPWNNNNIAYRAAHILRSRAIDWARKNLDVLMVSPAYQSEQTLGQEISLYTLARPYLDNGRNSEDFNNINSILSHVGDLTSIYVYDIFVDQYSEIAGRLGLKPIETARGDTNMINSIFTIARDVVNTPDSKLINNDQLTQDIDIFIKFLSNYYLDSMSKFSTYGGNIEVFILSQLLQKNIHIWDNEAVDEKYVRYAHMSFNSIIKTNDTINILYLPRHYETILPWKGPVPVIDDLGKMSCKQLREKLKSLGLPTSGKKAVLISRLEDGDVAKSPLDTFMTEYKGLDCNSGLNLFLELYLSGKISVISDEIYLWLENCLLNHADSINFTLVLSMLTDVMMRDLPPDDIQSVDVMIPSTMPKLIKLYTSSIMKFVGVDDLDSLFVKDQVILQDLLRFKEGDNLYELLQNGEISLRNQSVVAPLIELHETGAIDEPEIYENFLENFDIVIENHEELNPQTLQDFIKIIIYQTHWAMLYANYEVIKGNFTSYDNFYNSFAILDLPAIKNKLYDSVVDTIVKVDAVENLNGPVSMPESATGEPLLSYIPEDTVSPSPSPSPGSTTPSPGPYSHHSPTIPVLTPEQQIARGIIETSWQGSQHDIDYLLQQYIDGLDIDKITSILNMMTAIGDPHTRYNFDNFVRSNFN